jgi:hypothetical protein
MPPQRLGRPSVHDRAGSLLRTEPGPGGLPSRERSALAEPDPPAPASRRARRHAIVAGGLYLIVSLIIWANVLSHFASVTTCGCGDAALTLWVVKWPAYALSHGLNPFYSTKLFVPHGINMVPNSLALGIVAAPATWLFGPVASLNLIDLLSPPLSALAMFWLLRRWTSWAPAAFIGGLFFGFSPFVLVSLALGHPNFGLLAAIPLIVGCLDELFVRRRRSPLLVGAALGILVVIQFFVSVEVLALLVLFAALAAVISVARAMFVRQTDAAIRAFRSAGPGLAVAATVAVVLLAYPVWYFFAGPAHLVGRAWPDSPAGTVVNRPADFVNGFIGPGLTKIMHLFGGYQGPALPLFCFLGGGMIAVLVIGAAISHGDRRVQWFGLLGLIAVLLSFGIVTGTWTPWRLFVHWPVLVNVVPVNITSIVDTCVAIVLAVIIDRIHSSAREWVGRRRSAWVATAVVALAVVPIVVAFWPNIPLTVRVVRTPKWFTAAAPDLGSHLVVLPYPAALGGIQASMAWQATEGMTFSMVGGGGPGISPSRAGPERPGLDILNRASFPLGPPPLPTAANLLAIRQVLHGWGVTTIVVPDQPGLPTYDRGRSVPYAVGLFTAAVGAAPARQARAWVWTIGTTLPAPIPMTAVTFAHCTGGVPPVVGSSVAACVLRAE